MFTAGNTHLPLVQVSLMSAVSREEARRTASLQGGFLEEVPLELGPGGQIGFLRLMGTEGDEQLGKQKELFRVSLRYCCLTC